MNNFLISAPSPATPADPVRPLRQGFLALVASPKSKHSITAPDPLVASTRTSNAHCCCPPSAVSALETSHSSARRRSAARRYYQLSQQNLTEVDDISTTQPNRDSFPPAFSPQDRGSSTAHPVVRVSKRTHGAILYALEEALRYPNPFTPDLAEESANMADLLAASGGAIPHAHRGAAPPTTGAVPLRPSAAPVPTSSPSGIRGPRMIMMERAAREARREAAEKQRLEQARAEEEARQLEEMRRQGTEHQSARVADGRTANIAQQQAAEAAAQRQAQSSQERAQAHQRIPSHALPVQSPSATAAPQPPPSQAYLSQGSAAQQRRASESRPEPAPAPATDPAKPRNSFPHAFERWETLSAHWEGLTSYWIRKLEQNKDDVNRDPLSQQLARQVTDLSAAGANLFHAVVELQRLRASSERKFQRWFFETRSELERAQEVNALLEKALEKERRERSDAVRDAVDQQRAVAKSEPKIQEMKKELAISKEEARRAWEELGRREQEERDRTLSLQSGHPTIVGGVQVVPMTQSHSARQTSSRDAGNYQPADVSRTPTEHRSPAAPGSTGGYYAQPEGSGTGHRGAQVAAPQDEINYHESEYVLDAQGQPILDVHGKKIPTYVPPSTYSGSEQEAEEYETPATTNPPSGGHETPASGAPSGGSHSSNNNNGQWTGAYSNPQDYSGEGYGTPEWETIQRQNHHHPSRLSKIDEEDERSRASTSQISRI
ncbi:hypothetical protein ISF_06045 [Cordyceps fumosorosea ARSEF 2679]|uniref:Uncharacterized protein n=1 Tax=Cordyceps fumosorosea (strain ARSEF 2679) TaxID=1081104 RepID=A0A167SXK9_CORFA|nr:hypothetical protein ISF_06045 [Cordyceps fumosorosea ARSEF 2679]OAA60034.1 hypothetical protein ISF_06045 [Cordyceps fumosorosea ARSEF 2679]